MLRSNSNKKLGYRRVTARCVLSVVILPITTQQCETTYMTSPDQTDGMNNNDRLTAFDPGQPG